MKKWILRVLFILVIAVSLMSFGLEINDNSISVIFGVLGVIFPLACNQILSTPFSGIENQILVNQTRKKLSDLLRSFVYTFIAAAILYSEFYPDHNISFWIVKFSIHGIARYFILYILIYFAYNFLAIVRYRNEFEDSVREMRAAKRYQQTIKETEEAASKYPNQT